MPIEKKTGLFYELMIRGNWNPADGELGEVKTYMLQTGTALIDTDTNTLAAPYTPDPAVDLTKEQAIEFLGKKMADFLDQLSVERATAAKAIADRDAVISDLKAQLNSMDIRLDRQKADAISILESSVDR